MSNENVDRIRTGLDGLLDRPVGEHVAILSQTLDTIVAELDDLARTIPSAR